MPCRRRLVTMRVPSGGSKSFQCREDGCAVPTCVTSSPPAARFYSAPAERHGFPAAILTDNRAAFSGKSQKGKVLLEVELDRLGIACKLWGCFYRLSSVPLSTRRHLN